MQKEFANRLFGLQQPYFLLQSSIFDFQLKTKSRKKLDLKQLVLREEGTAYNTFGLLLNEVNYYKRVSCIIL